MLIKNLSKGKYINRPNRFTIEFYDQNNKKQLAHLHDPGRLKELLIKNVELLVKYIPTYKKTNRKTKYDIIAIKYNNEWVLLNSAYHNDLVEEIIEQKLIDEITEFDVKKREYTYKKSRFDFLLENDDTEEMLLEVKGCTLVIDKVAKFPDAPTKRGTKHVMELTSAKKEGKMASIIILILQNNVKCFTPNQKTDKNFSDSLKEAFDNGVEIYPTHIITTYKNNCLNLKYEKILPLKFKQEKQR